MSTRVLTMNKDIEAKMHAAVATYNKGLRMSKTRAPRTGERKRLSPCSIYLDPKRVRVHALMHRDDLHSNASYDTMHLPRTKVSYRLLREISFQQPGS